MTQRPFAVEEPIAPGITVLEASAGTGKTYAIAALATRFVADGVPLREMLLVTFTRKATAELRDRVRARLASSERALAGVLDAEPLPDPDDALLRHLASGSRDEVAARREHLRRAVAGFDDATISTIHSACQDILDELGIEGDGEGDGTLVTDTRDLLDEVLADLCVRSFRARPDDTLDLDDARKVVRAAVGQSAAALVEGSADVEDRDKPNLRYRLARAARAEFDRRKRTAGVLTYDDQLERLGAALADARRGASVAARMRTRWSHVLVDEFQDTDRVQWAILRAAFTRDDGRLILIGDPKQAIYAFRGADVEAYLAAKAQATTQRTLTTNWRSDRGLVDALDAVFGGAQLGAEAIRYYAVQAAPQHAEPRLRGAAVDEPLRVRVVEDGDPGLVPTRSAPANVDSARGRVALDVADEAVRLLRSDATVDGRPIEPGDLAVLVRRHADGERVRAALADRGVPVVIAAGNVYATAAADEWRRLLEALERPGADVAARAAALTSFLGWDAARLAAADEDDLDALHRTLHRWSRLLARRGVAALEQAILREEDLPARVLRRSDGERHLTDLRHVGELLHAAGTRGGLGASALAVWLRDHIDDVVDENQDEEHARRLESDHAAVQILTLHAAKGLEFPVVLLPFLWDRRFERATDPVVLHEGEHRLLDVRLAGPGWGEHVDRARAEARGEDLRLAYVGLTRAKHQAVLWWVAANETGKSPLTRLLLAKDDATGAIAPTAAGRPSSQRTFERLEQLAASAPGRLSVEPVRPGPLGNLGQAVPSVDAVAVARFDRPLDRAWRRTSFSALTATVDSPLVGSEEEARTPAQDEERPVDRDAADAVADAVAEPPADDPLAGAPAILGDLTPGARAGTLVHDLLEHADFAAGDLRAELLERARDAERRHRVGVEPEHVADGLARALATPLDPVLPGRALRDVGRADRLDELAFELPLVGGDAPRGDAVVTLGLLAGVLERFAAQDRFASALAPTLRDPALAGRVRGYLSGFVDLVVRDGERFVVIDHKTNRLGPWEREPTAWDFRPAALEAAMLERHYGLQALLYLVAVHRLLRWRVAGYDPDRHLGGVLYLFLRGMVGADAPQVDGRAPGVFAWQPPGALVAAASDALEAGA